MAETISAFNGIVIDPEGVPLQLLITPGATGALIAIAQTYLRSASVLVPDAPPRSLSCSLNRGAADASVRGRYKVHGEPEREAGKVLDKEQQMSQAHIGTSSLRKTCGHEDLLLKLVSAVTSYYFAAVIQ